MLTGTTHTMTTDDGISLHAESTGHGTPLLFLHEFAVDVLDGLGIPAAHMIGLSMGGFAALHLTLRHPGWVLSTVAAGTGYGAAPERQAAFRAECEAIAAAFENEGSEPVALWYAVGPARVLVLAGDEDEGRLDVALMLKRTIPTAGLAVLPRTGHTANLEEPHQFNTLVTPFQPAPALVITVNFCHLAPLLDRDHGRG